MMDGRHIENCFFGHNSAAGCPISVTFCSFSHNLAMEQTPALHRKVRLFNQMIGLQ